MVICTNCKTGKPFDEFGIRKMPNGKLYSISQCTTCRGRYSKKPKRAPYEADGL